MAGWMLATMAVVAVVTMVASGWLVRAGMRWLAGPGVERFDAVAAESVPVSDPRGMAEVAATLDALHAHLRATPPAQRIDRMRDIADRQFASDEIRARVVPVDAGGVRGEWVLAPGSRPDTRLLYLHGGAFVFGSALSHRRITTWLAEHARCSVLAIDYRLMPEHARLASLDDCRSAFRWMLGSGPEGAAPVRTVWVAGDSAGGNLALALAQWCRDEALRAPDAIVAFSPLTDATTASPSVRANLASDRLLGPLYRRIVAVPRPLLLWGMWRRFGVRPADPRVSPLFGRLDGLPPTLVQASTIELLRDDARRYAARARADGSTVELELWDDMVHVWQLFHRELPQAQQALERAAAFLGRHPGA